MPICLLRLLVRKWDADLSPSAPRPEEGYKLVFFLLMFADLSPSNSSRSGIPTCHLRLLVWKWNIDLPPSAPHPEAVYRLVTFGFSSGNGMPYRQIFIFPRPAWEPIGRTHVRGGVPGKNSTKTTACRANTSSGRGAVGSRWEVSSKWVAPHGRGDLDFLIKFLREFLIDINVKIG